MNGYKTHDQVLPVPVNILCWFIREQVKQGLLNLTLAWPHVTLPTAALAPTPLAVHATLQLFSLSSSLTDSLLHLVHHALLLDPLHSHYNHCNLTHCMALTFLPPPPPPSHSGHSCTHTQLFCFPLPHPFALPSHTCSCPPLMHPPAGI